MVHIAATPHRYALMDVARGFGILGIFWVNVFFFALPFEAMVIPGIWGEHNLLNIAIWDSVNIYFSGVMRGIVSIVFGGSALIMMNRIEASVAGVEAADRYFRRLVILIAFGLAHAYLLLWPHDILYVYGFLGFFLFPLRRLRARTLFVIFGAMLIASVVVSGYTSGPLEDAEAAVEETLTDTEIEDLRREDPLHESYGPSETQEEEQPGSDAAQNGNDEEAAAAEDGQDDQDFETLVTTISSSVGERQEGYLSNVRSMAEESWAQQTQEMFENHILDIGTFLILGMALFKTGFLTGNSSARTYRIVAVSGFLAGSALGFVTYLEFETGTLLWRIGDAIGEYTFDLRRLALALSAISVLALALRAGSVPRLVARLSDFGRLALSLYVLQTIAANLVFLGYGLGLYGTLEHFEIALVAAAVTLGQFVIVPIYMRSFKQGPLEILVRRLSGGAVIQTAPGGGQKAEAA